MRVYHFHRPRSAPLFDAALALLVSDGLLRRVDSKYAQKCAERFLLVHPRQANALVLAVLPRWPKHNQSETKLFYLSLVHTAVRLADPLDSPVLAALSAHVALCLLDGDIRVGKRAIELARENLVPLGADGALVSAINTARTEHWDPEFRRLCDAFARELLATASGPLARGARSPAGVSFAFSSSPSP